MITTTFIKSVKEFVDESGVIWTAVVLYDGSVWIRVEEVDFEFKNNSENGYVYDNMEKCLEDMEKSYGKLKEIK